jgi:lipopolysaccharide export system protein LptA
MVMVAALAGLQSRPALAGFDLASQPGDSPVEVTAEQGMEWSQDGQRITARGKAKAVRGNVTVIADTLIAFYSQVDSQTQISRLEAHGNVTIKTPTEEATGTQAIYDVSSALMTLKGGPAKIVTATDTITARDGIEYNENTKIAVARGDAMDIRQDRRVRADVLTATFSEEAPAKPALAAPAKKGPDGKPVKPTAGAKPTAAAAKPAEQPNSKMALEKAHAQGKVVVTSPTDIATGDIGDYDAKTGIITLSGSVKITRGDNQLNGGYAQFNMNSGIANMLASAPGSVGKHQRVQGLFTPQKDGQGTSAGKDKTNSKGQ